MPALTQTTLAAPIGAADVNIPLTSLTGVDLRDCLAIDGELMHVRAFLGTNAVVTRGASTPCVAHLRGARVYVGTPGQFHSTDPVGVPRPFADTPWINVRDRRIWHAMGDEVGANVGARFWQLETTTFAVGALGVRTVTTTP